MLPLVVRAPEFDHTDVRSSYGASAAILPWRFELTPREEQAQWTTAWALLDLRV